MFDTGRLRPGGRCSSRLPNDKPAVVQNRSSGVYPIKRACDSRDTNSNNSNNNDDLSIIDFKLLILGEGIEVEEKSFSEEVASQVNNTT